MNVLAKKLWSITLVLSLAVGFLSVAAPAQAEAAPTITNPATYTLYRDFPRRFRVVWDTISGVNSYAVSIECQLCTNNLTTGWSEIASSNINNFVNYYETNLPFDSEYRVRVKANYSSTVSVWSDYKYFRFTTGDLLAPTISSPAEAQTLSTNTFNATWTTVTTASKYAVEVDCRTCQSPDWSREQFYQTSDARNYYNSIPLTTASDYRIRVQSVDQYGNRGSWSSYVNFKYNGANGSGNTGGFLSAPTITAPANTSVISGSQSFLEVDWTQSQGALRYSVEVTCETCQGVNNAWVRRYDTSLDYVTYYQLPLNDLPLGNQSFSIIVRGYT